MLGSACACTYAHDSVQPTLYNTCLPFLNPLLLVVGTFAKEHFDSFCTFIGLSDEGNQGRATFEKIARRVASVQLPPAHFRNYSGIYSHGKLLEHDPCPCPPIVTST